MLVPALPKTFDLYSENGWSLETKKLFVENTLLATNRKGMDKVVEFLANTDFYWSPASQNYHSNMKYGLLNHSILVYATAMEYKKSMVAIDPKVEDRLPDESIAIATLLHDICKCCFYRETTKYKKDANGQWESYIGYEIVDTFPIGHGEKSVIMLQNLGLELNVEEMLAIRYHMGMFSDAGFELKLSQGQATRDCALVPLVQMSDFSASMVFEPTVKNK